MLVIISTILVLIGLTIIIFIILKKFPSLAILDVENIPGEKEAKFKERIIRKRLTRDLSKWNKFFNKVWHFFNLIISVPLYRAYNKLKAVRDKYHKTKKLTFAERRDHIKDLFRTAEDNLKAGELDKAETDLIEIISLEAKNLPAFIQLAAVYSAGKKWAEARQTLGYALKLSKASKGEHFLGDITLQEIHFSLASVNQNLNDLTKAIDHIREALEFEPNNPRFLDLAINLAIARGDKKFATEMFDRLREANPENAKLEPWQAEIEAIPEQKIEGKSEKKNRTGDPIE